MARNHTTRASAGDGTTTTRSTKHTFLSHILRILQFLSATTSLILFSLRLAKIIRLVAHASRSNGAVEGILAAAVLYTLIATILQLGIRGTGSNLMRMLVILLDILFVAAFIVVAVLTSPRRHGSSAPCTKSSTISKKVDGRVDCSLPWGTFILAIVSTILHAITVAFHATKDHRRARKNEQVVHKERLHNGNSLDSSNAAGGYGGDRV